jgi:hypothetical protein
MFWLECIVHLCIVGAPEILLNSNGGRMGSMYRKLVWVASISGTGTFYLYLLHKIFLRQWNAESVIAGIMKAA